MQVALLVLAFAGVVHAEASGRIGRIDLVWHWEAQDGSTGSHRADEPVNPASVVKLATTLWVLEILGPQRRFHTTFGIRGELDADEGVLRGDLVVRGGGDPDFHVENAQLAAARLRAAGIRRVEGALYVDEAFWIGWEGGAPAHGGDPARRAARMARRLADAWNPRRWDAATLRDMRAYRERSADVRFLHIQVDRVGGLDRPDAPFQPLFEHVSNPLPVILKRFNDYSNNDIERLGHHLGGAEAMSRFYRERWAVAEPAPRFATLSGLDANRLTPRQAVRLLRELHETAQRHELELGDLIPVLDCGRNTLRNYHGLDRLPVASVVAKTGTLVRTDGGVIALGGKLSTKAGDVFFFVAAPRNGARMAAARRAQTRWLLEQANRWQPVAALCDPEPRHSYSDAALIPPAPAAAR